MPSSPSDSTKAKSGKNTLLKIVLSAVVLLVAGLLAFQMRGKSTPGSSVPKDPIVGTINQETVSAAEYRLIMERKSSLVYSYFKQHHDLDDHLGYWSESSGPDGPLKKLREMVQEELVKIKVYQGLGKEKGLIQESDFANFRAGFERENARRIAARQSGEVIYGPQQYREGAYYYIKFGDLSYRLKQVLAKEAEPSITEADIQKFFKENKTAVGKKKLEEVRQGIVNALSLKEADKKLEALCAAAKVEMKEEQLRGLVPRVDPETASGNH